MNLILLGAPGAGKGTQSKLICERHNIPQISTGDILRAARKNKTQLGQLAEKYMVEGKLVPDEVVIGIVKERLSESDCQPGFILDGFPRTTAQADALTDMLSELGRQIQSVVSIEVPKDDLVKRLAGRRVCSQCGSTYHVDFAPTQKEGVCDKCDGEVIQRKDDEESTILERLSVYEKQTQPLIDYYKGKDLLQTVEGTGEVSQVNQRIERVLQQ